MNSLPTKNFWYSVTIRLVLSHLTLNSWYQDEYHCYLIMTLCHYADCHCAKHHYAECHYAKCR